MPASLTFTQFITPTKLTIDFLKELRRCVGKTVDEYVGTGCFEEMHTEYVITVPAIWSDNAKSLTGFCAQKAGMGNAKLITEPEAAMVHVLHGVLTEGFSLGDTYTICDAGGGTVDLITYKVTSVQPLTVEEVVQGDGGWYGSTYITRQFHEYILANHAKVVPSWTEKETAAALDGFENKTKRTFDDKDEQVVIKVPGARDFDKYAIKIHKQKVFIPAADIKVMFDRVCPSVVRLIKEQRTQAMMHNARITAIVLVGGFSQSPYLRRYLTNELAKTDKNIKIVAPKDGWSAVVRGALSRALPIVHTSFSGPQRILPKVVSRLARRFYGITQSRLFDANKDPESKK